MLTDRKIALITFGIALLSIPILAGAQPDTLKLSLDDARKMAIEQNTNVRNSAIDLEIAKKKVWETLAIGLPHIDGKAAYQFIPKVPVLPANTFDPNADPDATIELGVKQNITYDVTVSQLIFNGAYIVGVQATKVYYQLSENNHEKTVTDVNEAVVNNYYVILVAEESHKILKQNLENVNKTLYEIKEQYKQGFVENTDVDQLELTANTLQNAISQVENNLELSYRLMKILLGIVIGQPIALTNSLETDTQIVTSASQLVNEVFDIDQNVDFRIVNTAESIAKLDYKREKSNSLPVISAFYMYQDKWKKPFLDFTSKDLIGINLALPIFSSGQRSALVSQKRMALEKATNTRFYTANNLLMAAEQLRSDLKLKSEKYQIQKKSKDLADVIYNRTLEKYREGVASSLDLMNSQNQYLTNLTNYYQSIYDLATAKTKLEKHFNINQNIEK